MSTVLTSQQADEIIRRSDLPVTVYWSWFDHEPAAITSAYETGIEAAARELRTLANRLIRDVGGDPDERP